MAVLPLMRPLMAGIFGPGAPLMTQSCSQNMAVTHCWRDWLGDQKIWLFAIRSICLLWRIHSRACRVNPLTERSCHHRSAAPQGPPSCPRSEAHPPPTHLGLSALQLRRAPARARIAISLPPLSLGAFGAIRSLGKTGEALGMPGHDHADSGHMQAATLAR